MSTLPPGTAGSIVTTTKKRMNSNHQGEFEIRSLNKPLSQTDFDRLSWITSQYYPVSHDVESMLSGHINKLDTRIHIAMAENRILGYSMHSSHKEKTPFHNRKIPLFYQRLLYVDPLVRHKDLGLGLQIAGLRYQLGFFWLFRRFAVISLTNNPLVLRAFSQYNEYYPKPDSPVPNTVREFCQEMAPTLGCMHIDHYLRAHGTNEAVLSGMSYTEQWRSFLHSGHDVYDQQVLRTVFERKNGKIIHTGLLLVTIGYAKPMHFIHHYIERRTRKLCVSAGQITAGGKHPPEVPRWPRRSVSRSMSRYLTASEFSRRETHNTSLCLLAPVLVS